MHATNEIEILARVDAFIDSSLDRAPRGTTCSAAQILANKPRIHYPVLIMARRMPIQPLPRKRLTPAVPCSSGARASTCSELAASDGGGFHAQVVLFNHRPGFVLRCLRSADLQVGILILHPGET
jgi:hypothetical protein